MKNKVEYEEVDQPKPYWILPHRDGFKLGFFKGVDVKGNLEQVSAKLIELIRECKTRAEAVEVVEANLERLVKENP